MSSNARKSDWNAPSNQLKEAFTKPSDIFSVLLLLGPELVARAAAQQSGCEWRGVPFPISFSFGISFIYSLMTNRVYTRHASLNHRDERLLPSFPDCASLVINGHSTQLIRDYSKWKDLEVSKKVDAALNRIHEVEKTIKASLSRIGYRSPALSLTPCLNQWKREKWIIWQKRKQPFILTRGNGTQHAFVILANKQGLHPGDLATSTHPASLMTKIDVFVLAAAWVTLLVASTNVYDSSRYLLSIGAVGMLHNILVAAWRQTPRADGILLKYVDCVMESNVMGALLEVEEKYTKVGKSMLSTFLPNELRGEEKAQWDSAEEERIVQEEERAQLETEQNGRGVDSAREHEGRAFEQWWIV
ncbi:hypothetical protein BCR34DRAFT_646600 [Clohesyomyces aquaticus]|uniref:Uncharacterized protein n=1 Tax=Clohesyomyces aquaticus TaxID=1231657 RepID=A0A1Y1Y697_9PLEO|nr:hypothetical protein BCR34DRAFT_646600 [Clohesyomyces aquaticus]